MYSDFVAVEMVWPDLHIPCEYTGYNQLMHIASRMDAMVTISHVYREKPTLAAVSIQQYWPLFIISWWYLVFKGIMYNKQWVILLRGRYSIKNNFVTQI